MKDCFSPTKSYGSFVSFLAVSLIGFGNVLSHLTLRQLHESL